MDALVIVQMWFIMTDFVCQGASSNADDCNKLNSACCYNEYFDKERYSCVDCTIGSFGWNCEKQCKSGYYGFLCKNQCECDAFLCDSVRGCTRSTHGYNTNATMSFNDSTTRTITQQTERSSVTEKYVLTDVTEKYVPMKLFTLNLQRPTHAKEGDPDRNHPYHHDTNEWMGVSFLLIGSLTTIFIFGILFYLRTTKRCNAISRYTRQDINGIQLEADVERPANRTLAEEEPSDDYAEIRYSQFNECSSTFRKYNDTACGNNEIGTCRIGMRTMVNVYDRDNKDCEYSRLQLIKKQSKFIHFDGRQKPGYIHEDQEAFLSIKPSDVPNFTLSKDNTSFRNFRAEMNCREQNTKYTHDIIRSASESRLFDFQKNVQNGSPKSVRSMYVPDITREMQRDDTVIDTDERQGDDTVIDTDERPYSLCKL